MIWLLAGERERRNKRSKCKTIRRTTKINHLETLILKRQGKYILHEHFTLQKQKGVTGAGRAPHAFPLFWVLEAPALAAGACPVCRVRERPAACFSHLRPCPAQSARAGAFSGLFAGPDLCVCKALSRAEL